MIKSQNLPDEEVRIKKNMKQGKDAIVYSALFFWGLVVVKNSPATSTWIGGTCSCDQINNTWPIVLLTESNRWFMMFQLGHHF